MHSFRDKEVLFKPDMTSSGFLRQGAFRAIFHDGFWKSHHDFLLVVNGNFCPYSNGSEVIRNFLFCMGFPYMPWNIGGFGGKWPTGSENIEKHLHKGHFIELIRVFWAIVRWNRFTGIDCCMSRKIRTKIMMIMKGTWPVYFTTTWGCHRWNDLHQTWQGCWNAWHNHPIQISN